MFCSSTIVAAVAVLIAVAVAEGVAVGIAVAEAAAGPKTKVDTAQEAVISRVCP